MADNLMDPSVIGTGGLKGLQGIRANAAGNQVSGPTLASTYNALQQANTQRGPSYVGQYLPDNISRYDKEIRTADDLENIDRVRADAQPWYEKAGNALIGGMLSGLATAVQDISYLLDFESVGESLGLIEDEGRRYEEN